MKKFLAMALFALSILILQMPQAAAQEVYLGDDSYLLTETVSYKPVGGKMMTFSGTVREGSTKFDYDYIFYSDGLVVYDKMYYGEKRGSGRFNATSPGSYSNTVAYKAFVAILKMYGLI